MTAVQVFGAEAEVSKKKSRQAVDPTYRAELGNNSEARGVRTAQAVMKIGRPKGSRFKNAVEREEELLLDSVPNLGGNPGGEKYEGRERAAGAQKRPSRETERQFFLYP